MDWKTSLFIILIISMVVIGKNLEVLKHNKAVVCTIASWTVYRKPPVKFDLSDIDPTLCTHLVYAFAGLDEESSSIISIDRYLDIESEGKGYKGLTSLKTNYSHLKFILSVGGWNEGSVKFSKMAANMNKRKIFVRSAVHYLEKYKFDGLDITWKHPTQRGGSPEDKENFVTLIKELKEAFLPYGYILTASLVTVQNIITSGYDLVGLNRYLDLIILNSYDYYGSWMKIVGPIAPLRGFNKRDVYHVEYSIKYMLSLGVSPHKLVLGIPFYGRTYILTDPNVAQIEPGKTPATINGFSGPYINGTNFYGYNEVCLDFTKGSNWSYHWDDKSSSPFIRDRERVVSYENTRSIANKIKMAIDYNLGGLMVWTIDTDDFKGACNLSNDTYTDYIKRSNNFELPFQESLYYLNLPRADSTGKLEGKAYGISDNKIIFHLPEEKFKNYPLLRTINQAIGIALEEKEINDALQRVRKGEHVFRWNTHDQDLLDAENKALGAETCYKICVYDTN